MTPLEHLDALITSAYLNDPDDRVYRALMAQRDVEIQARDSRMQPTWKQAIGKLLKAQREIERLSPDIALYEDYLTRPSV